MPRGEAGGERVENRAYLLSHACMHRVQTTLSAAAEISIRHWLEESLTFPSLSFLCLCLF